MAGVIKLPNYDPHDLWKAPRECKEDGKHIGHLEPLIWLLVFEVPLALGALFNAALGDPCRRVYSLILRLCLCERGSFYSS